MLTVQLLFIRGEKEQMADESAITAKNMQAADVDAVLVSVRESTLL
jgi:hypothetical protein